MAAGRAIVSRRSASTPLPAPTAVTDYGSSSFRMYEAMALGAIPVYVWAEVAMLPLRDELYRDLLAVGVNVADVTRIP